MNIHYYSYQVKMPDVRGQTREDVKRGVPAIDGVAHLLVDEQKFPKEQAAKTLVQRCLCLIIKPVISRTLTTDENEQLSQKIKDGLRTGGNFINVIPDHAGDKHPF